MRTDILSAVVMAVVVTVFAADQWVTTGRDVEFPLDFYFVGVGASEKSQEAAKQMAMVEIRKQISVKVSATQLDEQTSLIAGGRETRTNRVESRARLTTSGDLQGVQVVKTAQRGTIYYALAVLDKKNFIANTRARMADLNRQLDALVKAARADVDIANMGQALAKLSDARKLIAEFGELRTLLSAATAVTDGDKAAYPVSDINGVYEKCVASLKMVKLGGDRQSFGVGLAPAEPFTVQVTADGMPVPMLPVTLAAGTRRVAEKFTDDKGQAEFYLGEAGDYSAGTHTCVVTIGLVVSPAMKKYLAAQAQTFEYTVISNPCAANVVVEVGANLSADRDAIARKMAERLGRFDIKHDPAAPTTVKVSLSAADAGGVQGLSENNSFITELSAAFAVVDDDGRQLSSFQGSAKGTGGSLAKSVMNGIDNLKVEKDLRAALDKICSSTPAARKKIAVFEFKNRTAYAYWWDLSVSLSDMIITKLINTGKFDVVERSQLDRIIEEKSLAQSGVVEETEAMQAAQLAGAELLLIGSAGISGGSIEADARIVDAKTGVAKCAMSSSSYALANLRGLAEDLVGQIKGACAK